MNYFPLKVITKIPVGWLDVIYTLESIGKSFLAKNLNLRYHDEKGLLRRGQHIIANEYSVPRDNYLFVLTFFYRKI